MNNNPTPGRSAVVGCRRQWLLLAALGLSSALGGCVALVGGAAVGGAVMIVDRRSTGAQVDDQTIELRAASAVTAAIGDRGNVSATSYNRVVLLTGQVPAEADRGKVETAVAKVENVRAVVNELAVMPNSGLSQQSSDSLITSKVKAALFETKGLDAAAIKVVTERNVVYLMGLVTQSEADAAANAARGVSGVSKVVKVFQTITPDELAAIRAKTAPASAPASAPQSKP